MLQGLILLILAPLVGVKLTVTTVLILIPFTFVLAFALSALGVAIASRMRSMQGFQVVMNFLMMPIFFLSGALFPLGQGLPDWMKVLTTIDPAAYGVDPIRRIVLEGTVPAPALNQMSLTFMGNVIPVAMEVLVLIGFGVVMLGVAVRNFRIRD
jgi:ABC-2 type transport system permease protein